MIAAKPSLLERLGRWTADGLNVRTRMPQGAPQIYESAYPDNCGSAFPFRFRFYLATNVLQINSGKLSFFLEAFRGYEATSGAGSNHNHTTPTHNHLVAQSGGTPLGSAARHYNMRDSGAASQSVDLAALNAVDLYTWATDGSGTSANDNSHTHPMIAGIYEGTTATDVTVKVNGVDRTVALGGPAGGFTANQTELALTPSWLTIGAWNLIELKPSNLGRIYGSLTVVSYIQSV